MKIKNKKKAYNVTSMNNTEKMDFAFLEVYLKIKFQENSTDKVALDLFRFRF